MGRPLRWNNPGVTYHVMNRGNRKTVIFEDDRDRKGFTRLLIETLRQYRVELLAGCQLGTHFHLIVSTPHGNLSDFMRQLEGRFARYFNWRHERVGHLFQGRFVAVPIENDLHLFTAAAYVFNNPVEAGFVARPEDWKWSTYAATVGLAAVPTFLSIRWIETLLPADSLTASRELLQQCMVDEHPVVAYVEAVDPTCAAAIRSHISDVRFSAAQPCAYRTLTRPPIRQLFASDDGCSARAAAIEIAHEEHGYKLVEIASCLGLHPSYVSKVYCAARRIRLSSVED